jgi:hypothetical protein
MVIALIIICCVLAISIAINFLLWQVLKKTFSGFFPTLEMSDGNEEFEQLIQGLENFDNDIAYDGEYYPGHLLLSVEPNKESETGLTQIMDFSKYEDYNIIRCSIQYNGLREEQYGIHKIPGVTVFQPMEGVWTWKFGWV